VKPKLSGLAWIAPPLLLSLLAGCRATEPIYVYETKEVIRDRYVAVPAELTQPVEIVELPDGFDVYALGAAYKAQKVRALQCNGKLAEISLIAK